MKIEIKSRWSVLFALETSTLKLCVEAAVKSGANLRGANLSGANLSGANLRGADLSSADLSDANLRGADLSSADLSGADLSGADLSGANLSGANLRGANLSGAKGFKADPTLPKRVAEAILNGPDGPKVEMETWHTCETVHCIAGWAIHLSGAAGYALEALVGSATAGALLMPSASKMFHVSNAEAIAWAKVQVKT